MHDDQAETPTDEADAVAPPSPADDSTETEVDTTESQPESEAPATEPEPGAETEVDTTESETGPEHSATQVDANESEPASEVDANGSQPESENHTAEAEPESEVHPTEAEPESENDTTDPDSADVPAEDHPAPTEEHSDRTEGLDDDAPDEEPSGFAALGLRDELLKALDDLGYEEPTPIQRETIPILLTGQDLLGQAATGTGKTAAFALPALQMIDTSRRVPQVLVLVPTRELAVQVSEAIFKYGSGLGVKVVPVFGGQPIQRQLQALDRGVHVVVATPGRALDHIGRGSLALAHIQTVILDEADEMLDMGFTDDIESILESTPDDRQTVLFSATMPSRITSIAKRYQRNPQRITIGRPDSEPGVKALVRQTVYVVQRAHKPSALGRILDIESPQSALVFCRTRTEVDQLTATMNGRGYRAEALHGGMDQSQRDRVMGRLRDGTAELLVATDVAARGLDIDTLTHVVNYDVPSAAESYVHRIGRVGRAGREGVAITLAEPRERRGLENIERLTKQKFDIATVPTVADLRAHQIESTVFAVREALTAIDLEDFNTVLHALSGEDSDRNIALAAIKLVHESRGATIDELEIPDASDRMRGKPSDGKKKFDKNKDRNSGEKDRSGGKGKRSTSGGAGTGFVHVSLGRKAGVRPGDLVGAIANETGLVGRDIGPIRISDAYSVVGVPEASVDHVIDTMQSTTMRGKRARVRRFVE